MTNESQNPLTPRTFRAKVTGRHAVTLPAELCRLLGIETGDTVEFTLRYGTVNLQRVDDTPPLDARGILAGYFNSVDDVRRYLEEEREGGDEREEAWANLRSDSPLAGTLKD